MLIVNPLDADAALYKSYVFDYWGEAVPTPEPYLPTRVIYGSDLNVGNFRSAQDIFVAPDNTLYIVDSGNNRIIQASSDFLVLNTFQQFEHDGKTDKFNNPQSVFITEDGHMFVADTNNQRIVRFDENGHFVMEIKSPEIDNPNAFPEHFRFRPQKIAIDKVNRLYVTVDGLYEGLMELDIDGNFRTFMGAPRVAPSAWQYLWYRLASDEQKQRMSLFLPTEFSSMALDKKGFILTTVPGGDVLDDHYIRKLSPAGIDVLRRDGFHPPMGDVGLTYISSITELSRLVDVIGRENEIYSVLDQRRGRVFTYDNNGNLLYVFGGVGQGIGLFVSAVAIDILDDQILVLDGRNNSITVFEPTNYTLAIHQAIGAYNRGKYELASDYWQQVITMNTNFDLAYSGVGDAYLRNNEYENAMHYYGLGNDRDGYSDAFYRYREQYIEENFSKIMGWLILIVSVIVVATKRQWRVRARTRYQNSQVAATLASDKVQNNGTFAYAKKTVQSIKYAKHVIFHPFDGFWDLKHEQRGTGLGATIILIFAALSYVFIRQYTGFVLNFNKIEELNIISEMTSILLPFALWCIANWGLTTLMDGKGSMKDVYIAGAYALTPLILINIPLSIISNYMTIDEGTFYYLLLAIGLIWSLGLLFIGAGVTHEYEFGKTIFTTIATIIGIGIIIFVGLLFFDVLDRMLRFIQEIYTELSFRS